MWNEHGYSSSNNCDLRCNGERARGEARGHRVRACRRNRWTPIWPARFRGEIEQIAYVQASGNPVDPFDSLKSTRQVKHFRGGRGWINLREKFGETEPARAFIRAGNAESDRIGSHVGFRVTLFFFSSSALRTQPDRRIKRLWKDDYIFRRLCRGEARRSESGEKKGRAGTKRSEERRGEVEAPMAREKLHSAKNGRLDRHKASLPGKFSKASSPFSRFGKVTDVPARPRQPRSLSTP